MPQAAGFFIVVHLTAQIVKTRSLRPKDLKGRFFLRAPLMKRGGVQPGVWGGSPTLNPFRHSVRKDGTSSVWLFKSINFIQ